MPPIPENNLENAWYTGIFYGAKKMGTSYLGRITKRFLKEKDGPIDCFEVNCLRANVCKNGAVLALFNSKNFCFP